MAVFGFAGITRRVLKSSHSIPFPGLQPNLGLLRFAPCLLLLALSAPRLPLKNAAPRCLTAFICRYDLDELNLESTNNRACEAAALLVVAGSLSPLDD